MNISLGLNALFSIQHLFDNCSRNVSGQGQLLDRTINPRRPRTLEIWGNSSGTIIGWGRLSSRDGTLFSSLLYTAGCHKVIRFLNESKMWNNILSSNFTYPI